MVAASYARVWPVVALGTMASALPAFLTGALGVQLRDELGLTATQIGLAMASSFTTAAVCSAPMGRLAERLGPRAAFRVGLVGSVVAMLTIALFARGVVSFCLLLAAAGVANSLNQPAANLTLSSHIADERLGMALAIKQSGMPAAALLGGAAVPAIALTVGWEWAFVAGALVAATALAMLPADPGVPGGRPRRSEGRGTRPAARPDMSTTLLVLYAVVGLLGATSAGAMVGFLTSGAEQSGLEPGVAGALLGAASLAGVLSRLYQGWEVDHRGLLPIGRVVWLFALGGLGVFALAIDRSAAYLIAPIPAFAFGWAWPGLFNLSVIRNNPTAPAAATGISQVGVFVGAALGPAMGGVVIDASGYRLLWVISGTTLLAGAAIAAYLRTRIRAARADAPTGRVEAPPRSNVVTDGA